MKRISNWTLAGSNTSNSSSLLPNGESPGGTDSSVVPPANATAAVVGQPPTSQKGFAYPSKSCRGRAEGRRRGAGQNAVSSTSQLITDGTGATQYDSATQNGGRGHSHRSSSTKDSANSANVCPTSTSDRGSAKDEKVQNKDLALRYACHNFNNGSS